MDRSVVLVTGASRGIGQATARLLSARGYRVIGTARKPGARSAGGVEMLPLDVTSAESVTSCVSAVLERAGRIDVLVNNAGAGLIGAIEETPIEDARALFDTNLFGTARMVNAVLPSMRQRRDGLIINFGSLAAGLPVPFHGYLSASGAGRGRDGGPEPGRGTGGTAAGGVHLPRQGVRRLGRDPPRGRPTSPASPPAATWRTCSKTPSSGSTDNP